ncbi:hypothetical protein Q3P50_004185 [Salmonella enterica]|nr:hypothetical protein [Salmonella enterica]
MSTYDAFDLFKQEDIYTFKKTGSFGRFSTINSFPIEFFLTSLKASELKNLTFARDINPGATIDFDQLLQRDLDTNRVETEIKPYITLSSLSQSESKSRTIFFPPLLVAAVPVSKNTMEEYYSEQQIKNIEVNRQECIHRVWDNLFKLTFRKDDNYQIVPSLKNADEKIGIAREPVIIEINLSNGIEKGIKLVVIDGQHRLKALQEIYEEDIVNDPLKEMAVPLCILFSPNSTKEIAQLAESKGISIPKVPEIFRQLFVDVNKNAEQVGGHFNILLSEGNMGSLICRRFCAATLEKRGYTGLAQIEWNQKKKKLSTEINKKYCITSIGVLEKALSENFGKYKSIFNYFIEFDEIKDIVYSENLDDSDMQSITWDKFSLSQKKHLVSQINKHVIPNLDRLFFKTELFSVANNCFVEEIKKLEIKAEGNSSEAQHIQHALDYILRYTPISNDETLRKSKLALRVLEEQVGDCKNSRCFHLLGYAIFQRAIFKVWIEILKISKFAKLPPSIGNEYFFSLLNKFGENANQIISPEKSYCQHFIYSANKINPVNEVRIGLSYLILSMLANKDVRENILSETLKVTQEKRNLDIFFESIENLSYTSINNYIELYKKSRTKDFKNSYMFDRNIKADFRLELQNAEATRKLDEKDYKDGKISKDKISNEFERLAEGHITKYIVDAQQDIQRQLNLTIDVFVLKETIMTSDEDHFDDYSDEES